MRALSQKRWSNYIAVGDLTGMPKVISALLPENLRMKSVRKPDSEPREVSLSHAAGHGSIRAAMVGSFDGSGPDITRSRLIQLRVTIHGTRMNAIVDSGSQLNVIQEELLEEVGSLRAIDRSVTIRMNDANGGQGF